MSTPMTRPSAGRLHTVAARLRVGVPAQVFRQHLAVGDLAGAWRGVDPALRWAWTRRWTHTSRAALGGLCPVGLAIELAALEGPAHPLWRRFASDQLQTLHQVERSGQWRSCPGPARPPADVTVLYADPRHLDTWALPSDPGAVPMLMRWNGTTWLVLNYASTTIPPTGHPD
ncbi:hypothetical protein [Micrococcus terreus]|uniref:Uncharacterized protein n=1 Tax=Micrococcus terreus TaxID=574650 RepID=A0A1I7MT13_9MICC|nr:hypothetical protein [Micrococcus terreus]SFV25066.1 hypothetical protein SAMN04487966_11811 [Micrococcus terreus]